MKTIKDALEANRHALHYGNRLILPFTVDILKVAIEKDIITDFSRNSKGAEYRVHDYFTEIYFHDYKSLEDVVTKYEVIKMVVVERGKDLFIKDNHRKISIDILENHKTEIKEIEGDQVFID